MAMGSASVSNCLTKSVKYELLFIPRVYGLPFDHFRRYRVCVLDFFFPVYVKSIILQVRYDTTREILTATTTEVKHDCLGMM